MPNDVEQIRALVKTWLDASQAGDLETVLSLMTDDVVFLRPGHPPMNKSEFATQSTPPAGQTAPQIEGKSNILEITVAGDLAYMMTELSIRVTPPTGPTIERAGHTMSILKKINGRWLLAGDANMLTTVKKEL